MEADEISWLRANKHKIVVGTTGDGLAMFAVDGENVWSALDQYLDDVLEGSLGDVWFAELEDPATGARSRRIIFRDPQVSMAQLQGVLDRI